MTEMPQHQRRETCWRVIEGPTGRLVVCAIYETTGADFELRMGYIDQTLRADLLPTPESARARAEQWLDMFRDAGALVSITAS